MQTSVSNLAFRALLLMGLGSAGIFAAGCSADAPTPVVAPAQDFSAIDEAIIKKYITDNAITTAQKQPSGLYYVPVTSVPGAVPATAGRTVSVLYTGRFMDGRVFDASSQHGNTPISFVLGTGRVIKGWDEGIALMRKGEKGQLLIPSALAYGAAGAGSSIPPNTVLRFEVELTDVQ